MALQQNSDDLYDKPFVILHATMEPDPMPVDKHGNPRYPTKTLFRPVRAILFVCGAYVPYRFQNSFWFRVFRTLLLIGLFTVVWSSVAVIARFYHIETSGASNPKASYILCVCIMSSEALISGVFLVWWQWRGSLRLIRANLRSISNERAILAGLRHHRLYVSIVTMITILLWCGLMAANLICDDHRRELVTNDPYLGHLSLAAIGIKIAWWLACNIVFIITCHFIHAEVVYFNRSLQRTPKIDKAILQDWIKAHARVAETLDSANRSFGAYVFIMLCGLIPAIILMAYEIMTSVNVKFSIYLSCLMGMSFLHLLSLTLNPALIYDETSRTSQILLTRFAKESIWQDTETREMATWLVNQANTTLGLNAGGFFLITKSLILTTVSLIVSYLMLLIQLAPSASSSPRQNASTVSIPADYPELGRC